MAENGTEQSSKISMDRFSKEHIQSLRLQLGLSQEGFARELGVSFATVNRWETGKSRPSQLAQRMISQIEEDIENNDGQSEP